MTTSKHKKQKALNISLWIAQVLLAAMFLLLGAMKSKQPIEQLADSLHWVKDVSVSLVRFIGVSELLGGIGLILPALLRIKPTLAPVAALGIIAIMVLASGFHISRGEFTMLPMNFIFALIAVFIAWGRFRKIPIQAK